MKSNKDKKIHEYNHHVVKKLFSFAAPYRNWFIFASLALIFSTAAELSLPVLMQQTIDRHILSVWYRIPENLVSSVFQNGKRIHKSEDSYFIPESDLPSFDIKDYRPQEEWYVFPMDETFVFSESRKDIIPVELDNGGYGALPKSIVKTMNKDDYYSIRKINLKGLGKNSILYFLLLCLILILSFGEMYTMAWTSQGVMKDLRVTLLGHTMKQSLGYLGDTPVGTLVSRITSDVETINEFFTSVTISVLRDLTVMAGALITLYFLNPHLALITILTTPPILILTWIFRKLARNAYRGQRHWIGKVNGFLSEHITGMEVIQLFGQEKKTAKEFKDRNRNLLKASLAEMYVFAIFRPMVDLFTSVSLGVVIYIGAGLHIKGYLTLGVLIAFIDLIQKFYRPVMDLSEKFTIMQSAMAGGERIFQLLDEDHAIADTGKESVMEKVSGKIDFKKVKFAYKKDDYILKDLSFSVDPGETIAIVGYTGAGKTTIASLISRFWDIQSGEILLDDKNIKDLPLDFIRHTIQAVQQDVFLFSGTVLENITLGMDIPMEKVEAAAGKVQADSFIRKMDRGYHSYIQERGSNLSAGQRQLIAFARILVHNPSVVVLDEATANIDSETEKLVQKAIEEVLKGRTSLVIAHRISTIQKADKILVFSQGELVEQGTHEQLIARKDLYYSLYKLQYEKGVS